MTKLYQVIVPLYLAIEADSPDEARRLLRQLWRETGEAMPVGATAFEKDERAEAHLRACMTY